MTLQGKKWLIFTLIALLFFVLYWVLNLAIYTAWKSAFTGADVDSLRVWFYFYCGVVVALIVAEVLLIRKGLKLCKGSKSID
jgi:fucose permease